ncbi:MAG: hypothetical protein HZB26_04310, partial [Candidatus Hydrogenedentes bacterium]|nr:hypothetical protein [Candidatus Hydrogenedentota bacterium]
FFRFRMAMMIYTDDGNKVMDFFEGISGGKDTVDNGDARVEVPELSATHAADAKKTPIDPGASTRDRELSRWMATVASFADLFPERVGTRFTLGFKEFDRHAYCLTDVPKGTAFVWFQTKFDGNRVMQFPAKLRIEPKTGDVTRLDIHLGEVFEHFWML